VLLLFHAYLTLVVVVLLFFEVDDYFSCLIGWKKRWGLGAKLIRETLPLAGTPFVELIAVMAKYSPFAEKAGMRKVAEQQSVETVSKISIVLLELGFDLHLLGSERYVKAKLENLTSAQLSKIRGAFVKNSHPRFKKEFATSRHQPLGLTSDYIKGIENADSAK
jgi:hypothetical protein